MGSSLTTDGALGSQTQEVAKQFQKKYGLTADGKVGPATYKKIQEVWTEKNPGKSNPLGIVPINTYTPNHVVKFNSALKEIC
jgi:peptidoglycan hydrolase-like protein with peptidoglycan-binding domain